MAGHACVRAARGFWWCADRCIAAGLACGRAASRWLPVGGLGVVLAAGSTAAPPPGADPTGTISRWLRTAKDVRGNGCCDWSDCRPVAVQPGDGDAVFVWIGADQFGGSAPNAWVRVPEAAKRATADGPPPDGRTWACYYQGRVACYLEGAAG